MTTIQIAVRISPTIANEYATRDAAGIPDEVSEAGRHLVSLDSAKSMLADANYNSDKRAFDIGQYGMPLATYNAYRALAVQITKTLATTRTDCECTATP